MKRTRSFAILGTLLLFVTALRAQSPSGQQPPAAPPPSTPAQSPPPAAEPEAGAPLSKLDLSNDQKKQIHNIRKESQQEVQKVRSDTSLTQQQQTQQIRQIRHSATQKVEGVLTPDQRAKYDAWHKAHQRQHHASHQQPS
jgi:Spy/CpxP family protein refolding chaperone